jgi:hypothetical protein
MRGLLSAASPRPPPSRHHNSEPASRGPSFRGQGHVFLTSPFTSALSSHTSQTGPCAPVSAVPLFVIFTVLYHIVDRARRTGEQDSIFRSIAAQCLNHPPASLRLPPDTQPSARISLPLIPDQEIYRRFHLEIRTDILGSHTRSLELVQAANIHSHVTPILPCDK